MSSRLQAPPIDSYRPQAPFLDEMFHQDGTPRETARALVRELARIGPEGLVEAGRRREAIFMQQGITFETSGAGGPTHERPFPLDLIPRVLSGVEWRAIKRGLAQRIRALNHFVDDVYHAREIVREGVVPWRLVCSRSHFTRAVHGIRPPGGVYTHVAGCDLVRDSDGTWKVIEDNIRIPSGISYVLENRAAMARLVPELFASYRVRPVDHYPQLLLRALRSVAPSTESEATVVVWTPGPANPAYFEHAFLARQMGAELVEASDLVVRDDVLYMRTTRGLERAHAVYRRLDDDFVDPLEFRADSLLGVPGLVRAYRAGSVGSSIADLLQTRAGVCQDFVHLALVLLRRHGIAARYVSGYLWAASEDEGTDSVEVDTHAWLEALLPGTDGRGEPVWVSADPTNRRLAGETHVKIGHGRFYADVPPVKGLYMGGASSDLHAAVTMSRLDPQASARA